MSVISAISPASVGRLRKASKADVAEFFEMTVTSVDGWIRRGCPVVQRGKQGQAWVFDLLAVAEWRFGGKLCAAEDFDPDRLQPAERKAWYDSETKRRDLQIRDRELIPAGELEACIASAFGSLSQGLRSIPDNLERRVGCSAEIAEAVEKAIEAEMDAVADLLSTLSPVGQDEEAQDGGA